MAQDLDSEEFAEAYASALKAAARLAKENGEDISLAEDAAQEAVLKILRRKKTGRIRSWFAYVKKIVRLEAVKIIRRRNRLSEQELACLSASPLNSAEDIYRGILVDELRKQLPEKDLEIVRLCAFHGFNFNEVSAAKHISVEAARKRYYRGVKVVQAFLERQGMKERGRDGNRKAQHG